MLAGCGSGDVGQIKAVIERANHEQEDAFAARDASIMQDTSTAANFVAMTRRNEEIAADGTVGIRLAKLEWGDVRVTSATTAEATTWETWEETDQSGQTLSVRDRNVYSLLKVGSSWKIENITYPDRQTASDQPSPSLAPAQ